MFTLHLIPPIFSIYAWWIHTRALGIIFHAVRHACRVHVCASTNRWFPSLCLCAFIGSAWWNMCNHIKVSNEAEKWRSPSTSERQREGLAVPLSLLRLSHQREEKMNAAFACLSAGLRGKRMLAWVMTTHCLTSEMWMDSCVFLHLNFCLLKSLLLCTHVSEEAKISLLRLLPFVLMVMRGFVHLVGGRTDVIGTRSV